jgi:hypothetical protein
MNKQGQRRTATQQAGDRRARGEQHNNGSATQARAEEWTHDPRRRKHGDGKLGRNDPARSAEGHRRRGRCGRRRDDGHGGTAASAQQPAKRTGANETIVLGLIGVGGRGYGNHIDWFGKHPDVAIGAVCDVHPPYVERAVAKVRGMNRGPVEGYKITAACWSARTLTP